MVCGAAEIIVTTVTNLLTRLFRLRDELLWVATGHLLAFLGGLLGVKILTSQLGTDGYGHLALGLSIAGFLTSFLHNPLSNAVARFYAPYRDTDRLSVYFGALKHIHKELLRLILPFLIVASLLLWCFTEGVWWSLVFYGLLFGAISGIGVSFLAWQNAARDRRGAMLAQTADVWLRIGFAFLGVYLFGTGTAALAGYCIGVIFVLLWQYLRFRKTENRADCSDLILNEQQLLQAKREFFLFSMPFVGYALFTVATLYADRWILQAVAGAASVGIYAALFQIAASPVNLLFAVINQFMVPLIYERAGSMETREQRFGTRQMILRTVLIAVLCSAAGTLLTAILAHPVAELLTTKEFASMSGILWKLVLGLSLWNIGQLMALEGICANQPGIYLLPKGLHALVLVACGIYLVEYNGVAGMAFAIIIAAVFYIASVFLVNFRLQQRLGSAG